MRISLARTKSKKGLYGCKVATEILALNMVKMVWTQRTEEKTYKYLKM